MNLWVSAEWICPNCKKLWLLKAWTQLAKKELDVEESMYHKCSCGAKHLIYSDDSNIRRSQKDESLNQL